MGCCLLAVAAKGTLSGAIWGAVLGTAGGAIIGGTWGSIGSAYGYMKEHGTIDGSAHEILNGLKEDAINGAKIGFSIGFGKGASDYLKSATVIKNVGTDLDIPNTKTSINQGKDLFKNANFKKPDIKMVNDAANQIGIDRNAFGEYIHEIKASLGMKANQNFTYKELLELAKELKNIIG